MTMTAIRTTTTTARTGRHRSARPRTLNLVDLENLVGGQVAPRIVQDTWSELLRITDARYDDHSTVAVSKRHAATAFFALPSTIHRVVGADRPDGADIALLEAVDIDWAVEHFRQVVIASGDHIFAPLARQFRMFGMAVVQVTGVGRCSAELYGACSEHRYLSTSRPLAEWQARAC